MDSQSTSRFSSLKYPDFRLLWTGQLISNIGTQMQMVALNWHIYLITHSALALGLIGFCRFIPIVVFSLIGGTFADAHNRKTIMLSAQIMLTILSGILAITTLTNTVSPFIIYTITIGSSIAMAFDMPARQALIPKLVEKKDLPNAISLNMIMFQTSMILGPALAGVFIAQIGLGSIYTFNAFSFIAVIIALIFITSSGDVENSQSPVSLAAIWEGLVYVKSKTIIWSTMLLDFFSTFFGSATALFPIFAKDILHVGPQGLGLLYSAPAIGAVFAGVIMAQMHRLEKQGKILLIAVIFYGLGTIIFGLSQSFALSFFAMLIVGAGDSVSTIIRNTIRQITTPDYIRGRMTSVNMIFFMGGPQAGEFEAGVLAAAVGAPLSVVIGGAATIAIVLIMAASIPILRNYDTH